MGLGGDAGRECCLLAEVSNAGLYQLGLGFRLEGQEGTSLGTPTRKGLEYLGGLSCHPPT